MDQGLAGGFAARSDHALDGAYRRYARELLAVAQHVVGRGDAEDCVHDALLRAWRTPDSYHPSRGTLRAFLIACVRNEAMSRLRSGARRAERERRVVRLEPQRAHEDEIVDVVEAARVRAALGRLPPEQRTALEMAYYRNLTHVAIASELGVPLGTIKTRLALALRRLRREMIEVGA